MKFEINLTGKSQAYRVLVLERLTELGFTGHTDYKGGSELYSLENLTKDYDGVGFPTSRQEEPRAMYGGYVGAPDSISLEELLSDEFEQKVKDHFRKSSRKVVERFRVKCDTIKSFRPLSFEIYEEASEKIKELLETNLHRNDEFYIQKIFITEEQ